MTLWHKAGFHPSGILLINKIKTSVLKLIFLREKSVFNVNFYNHCWKSKYSTINLFLCGILTSFTSLFNMICMFLDLLMHNL